MDNIREIVLDSLIAQEKEGLYSHKLIADVLDKYDYLSSQDKGFIKRLFEGCIERRITLDYQINRFASVKVNKMKPLIRQLCRMSVYQILYMDAVPDSSAINEAVKLAKKRHFVNLSGFINGLLRNISREKGKLVWPDKATNPLEYLSVMYSVPEHIISMWLSVYDTQTVTEMLEHLLAIHPVSMRFKTDMDESHRTKLLEQMTEIGLNPEATDLPFVYTLSKAGKISDIPGYNEGKIYIQDISSIRAILAAGIKPGDFVIDACSAPGGKAILAAELAGEEGRVISRDVSEAKVDIIEENIARMGATNITAQVWDALDTDETLNEKADVLLLDVPCSGLGILGKKRDIKYRITEEDLSSITELQWNIVKASANYVKHGGTLLYSTCTINRAENEEMVRKICDNLDFEVVQDSDGNSKIKQLLPTANADGFFYAVLKRK